MIHLFRMGWIGVGGGATHTPNLRQRFRFEANALTVSNFRRAYLSLSLSLPFTNFPSRKSALLSRSRSPATTNFVAPSRRRRTTGRDTGRAPRLVSRRSRDQGARQGYEVHAVPSKRGMNYLSGANKTKGERKANARDNDDLIYATRYRANRNLPSRDPFSFSKSRPRHFHFHVASIRSEQSVPLPSFLPLRFYARSVGHIAETRCAGRGREGSRDGPKVSGSGSVEPIACLVRRRPRRIRSALREGDESREREREKRERERDPHRARGPSSRDHQQRTSLPSCQ